MASVRYRKRGDSNLWTYEIRNEGKTVAHNSGFKTKKLAESEAEPILQELRLGKRISRDISLADLYQEWLELKILPSSRSEETKKKYLLRKNTIERLFGNKKVTQIRASEYQRIMNKYGQTVGRNFLGRLNTGPRTGQTGHRQRHLHPRVGVRGYGGQLGKRHRPLPAARQMEPWRYAGGTVPGRTQHCTYPGMDRKRSRGAGGKHPSRHGKIHHAHPGTAAHEPAAPENGVTA